MKSILLLFSVVTLTLTSTAQSEFGIFGGPQVSTARYSVQGKKQETEFKYGFTAGAGFKIPFENRMYFAPAIYYGLKGYKVKFTRFAFPPGANAIDNNTTIHSVELAALLHFDLGSQPSHMFFKIGPALDFHLFGNEKFNLAGGGMTDRKMPFGFGEYGHYSASGILHVGYEASSGLVVFAHVGYGLVSTNNHDFGPQIHHRYFGISIGKYFKSKKIEIDTRVKE